jgi:hypothetical protein
MQQQIEEIEEIKDRLLRWASNISEIDVIPLVPSEAYRWATFLAEGDEELEVHYQLKLLMGKMTFMKRRIVVVGKGNTR